MPRCSFNRSRLTANRFVIINSVCKRFNINHSTSTAYHHQTNGKCERFNAFLKKSIALLVKKGQSNWIEILDRCLFLYRISLSRALNDNPFYLLYGRDVKLPQDFFTSKSFVNSDVHEYVQDQIKRLQEAYAKLNLHKTEYQMKYKAFYDKSHNRLCLSFVKSTGWIVELKSTG